MSGVKRLLEDVADDVEKCMADGNINYETALINTLIDRKIIESANDVETIALWDTIITPMVA